jgi:hypothetical protein
VTLSLALDDLLLQIVQCGLDNLSVPPGRAVLVPGGQAAWDDCCEGQLSLRLISVTPTLGGATDRRPTTCTPPLWTVSIGLSLVRCIATVDDKGRAPKEAAITMDGLAMVRDMRELLVALECCVSQLPGVEALKVGQWLPHLASGGCSGGEWEASFILMNCACP